MTNTELNNKIEKIVKASSIDILTLKLSEIWNNRKLMKLNIAIQEELENRLGEEEADKILDNIRIAFN
jgi:hypothetical protein